MSETLLKNVKKFNCFKEIIFMDNNDTLYDSFTLLFAEIYLCELNILLTFKFC